MNQNIFSMISGSILMSFIIVLILAVAIPWIIFIVTPVLIMGSIIPILIVDMMVLGTNGTLFDKYSNNRLKLILQQHIEQWSENVQVITKVDSHKGKVRLITQFISGNNQWYRSVEAINIDEAISRLHGKLVETKMPIGNHTNNKFLSGKTLCKIL